ncbi:DUF7266 family protein [Halobellus sp. GM3]|uniref:DUF7266 family protein n=1 Tax=Halobellus sp. GM3 TaxID=3458410 RepID=UPI00403D5583
MRTRGGAADRSDRAVSITVSYVIALGITAVLISGLLVGAGGYVESQRDSVVREELSVVGEQLAAGIDDADRLSRSTATSRSVRVGVDLPRRVAGESYRIDVAEVSDPPDQPGRYELTLRPTRSDVSVTLTVSTIVPLREGSTGGGWTVVRLDTSGADPRLVLEDGDPSASLSLVRPTEGVKL